MKKRLNNNCYIIDGAKNSAIYDLNNNKVYSINAVAKNIISKILIGADNLLKEEEKVVKELEEIKILIDEDGSDIKEVEEFELKPRINFAWLEITEACNLNCVHCYGEFGQPKINNSEVLSLNDWKIVLDKLKELNCESIQLIGGEPMAHKYVIEIMKYAYSIGIKQITIFTNATLIDDDQIDEFKKCEITIRTSIYGPNAEVHDKVTASKGSFEINGNTIRKLISKGVPVSLAHIVMKENEGYIEETKQYIESLGCKYGGYDVIRPGDVNTKYNHAINDYTILEKTYQSKPEFYINRKAFETSKIFNPCWNSKVAIKSNGDVIPCVFSRDNVMGNVKKDDFEVLKTKVINGWGLTKDKIDGCKDCEYRYACHDCRPLAIGVNGDINSKNPRCLYNPHTGIWEDIKGYTTEIKKD